jgi:hypothetical protein
LEGYKEFPSADIGDKVYHCHTSVSLKHMLSKLVQLSAFVTAAVSSGF